jgi:uncharacterized protein YjbJ (UPF0337 family)
MRMFSPGSPEEKIPRRQLLPGKRRISVGRRKKTGQDDRNEGAMDKAKGRLKEASGALTGNKEKKPRAARTSAVAP